MIVVPGSGSPDLGLSTAKELGATVVGFETRRFPDGERYVRLTGAVKDDDAVIIQSLYKDPDSLLVEYVFLANTLFDLGVRRIMGVFPYLAYMRQDQRFKDGEAVSSKIISSVIEASHTSEAFIIDPHLHRTHSLDGLFSIRAHNVSAMPDLARYAKGRFGFSDPLVVAPDEEASQWASKVAEQLGVDHVVAKKVRLGDTSVEVELEDAAARGRDVLLVDDIISTGGTLANVAADLKKAGAKKVVALVTHGLFAPGAYERIRKAGVDDIVTTDSVPNPHGGVSVAPVIARALESAL